MLSQIQWWRNANNSINPLSKLNFIRAFMQWKNGRQMDQYISAELERRYDEYKADPNSVKGVSVIDLVLRAYLSGPYKSSSPPAKLDAEFRSIAIRHIRLFVFAGHDSTASSICYIFHLLSKHPDALARLRTEHDEVLGTDPAAAASKISANPRLVNNLPYTLAVIKESMRLFPAASASREGSKGVNVTDDSGRLLPTEDTILWILHVEVHQWDKYWVRGDKFLPERWMVPANHPLHPRPGTWRPFELGPRNCIAQAMVLVELRIVLACLARSFGVTPAYEEWDRLRGRSAGTLKLVNGERAYQVERGAAHPVEGYPCRVSQARYRA
jgi:cytochrome P450